MENLKAAIFGHPETSPEWFAPRPYLLEVPSIFAPTSALLRFRDGTLAAMIAARPDDGFLQAVAVRLGEVLAYRSALPPALHFWRGEFVRCSGCGRCFFVSVEASAALSCFVCGGSGFELVERSAIPSGVTLSAVRPEVMAR